MVAVHFWILAIGAGLALGPLLLHLLMQQKPKRIPFPAMRFIKEVQHKAKRSFRMRHWLLLLLRILLPLLFAAALARPSAANAIFGSYWLLGLVSISAIIFGFLTVFWWQKSKDDRPAESTPSRFTEQSLQQKIQASSRKLLASRLPVFFLAAILLLHIVAASWLVMNISGGPTATVAVSGQEPVSAVILIDTSPRMQYRKDNAQRLDHSKELANWILDQLPPESQIAILDSQDLIPGMSLDHAAARNQIENLKTTYLPVSVKKRISDAVQLLEESQWEGRELYVLSDMTAPGWDTKSGGTNLLNSEGLSHSISSYIIDTGTLSYDNWQIQKWELAASTITPNGTCSVKATIARLAGQSIGLQDQIPETSSSNPSDDDESIDQAPAEDTNSFQQETRTIRIFIEKPETGRPTYQNGKNLVSSSHWERFTQVSLDAGQTQQITLQIPNLPPGEHQGWIEIDGGDALPFDNRRHFTIRVESARKILIVNGSGVSETNLREAIDSYALREAGQSSFDCVVAPQNKLSNQILQDYRTVYLLDPNPIEDQQWRLLSTFVRRGGSLGIFLGHNASDPSNEEPTIDPSFNSQFAQEILPGNFDENPWRDPSASLILDPSAWDHPVFKGLRSSQDQLSWNKLPIFVHWGIDPSTVSKAPESSNSTEPNSDAADQEGPAKANRILAEYSNNQPAIIETQYGQGFVLTVTTPITDPIEIDGRRSWNTFSSADQSAYTYWRWINDIAEFLATANSGKFNGFVGEAFLLKNESGDAPRQYTLYRPQDAQPVEIQSEKGQLTSLFSKVPGNYRLKGINTEKKPFLKGYAVNCLSGISDLKRIDYRKLETILGKENFSLATSKDQIIRKKGKGKLGLEFYPSLIRLLAVFFLAEMIFSNWFYRSDLKSKKPELEGGTE